VGTIRCAFEDEDFEASVFDEAGVHKGVLPKHDFTGNVYSEDPGGRSPVDRPPDPS